MATNLKREEQAQKKRGGKIKRSDSIRQKQSTEEGAERSIVNFNKVCLWRFLFKKYLFYVEICLTEGVKVSQKIYAMTNLHHNMQDIHVYVQYETFLIKCTKGNKMKKVKLKIDKICTKVAQFLFFSHFSNSTPFWQWSTTNWCFQEWLNNALGNNTIKCKKLATIVLGWKNVAQFFVRLKQASTSAEM